MKGKDIELFSALNSALIPIDAFTLLDSGN